MIGLAGAPRCTGASAILTPLTSFTGTNATSSVAIGTHSLPPKPVYIQNGGLANTNAMVVYGQVSIDNLNFVTICQYQAAVTNAQTDTYTIPLTNVTIYLRALIVTTNAVGVGIFAP